MEFPLVVRMPYGGGVRAPELHDDSPEAYYVHTPGVKVAIPSTPADAKGLLAAAIRDPDPVVVLEPKLIYRAEKGEVPEGEHVVPLGQARLAREGADIAIPDLQEASAESVAREVQALGRPALGLRCDATREADIRASLGCIKGNLGASTAPSAGTGNAACRRCSR